MSGITTANGDCLFAYESMIQLFLSIVKYCLWNEITMINNAHPRCLLKKSLTK